jgi:hypothetical protein
MFRPSSKFPPVFYLILGCHRGLGTRHIEFDRGASFDLAIDRDVTIGLLDEPVVHAQAKAAALAHVLSGEERLEHFLQNFGRHSESGVVDGDFYIVAGRDVLVLIRIRPVQRDVGGLDRQRAALRHGVAGIDRQIGQGILELMGIDRRGP